LLVLSAFIAGYIIRPIIKPCPQIASDTVKIVDTNYYSLPPDTLYLPSDTIYTPGDSITVLQNVDTAAILKDYLTRYRYPITKTDTNITITGVIDVYRNKLVYDSLAYKWHRPTTIINNKAPDVYNYYRYLSVGLDIPVKQVGFTEVDIFFHSKSGYLGLGYTPGLSTINLKAGFNIIKF